LFSSTICLNLALTTTLLCCGASAAQQARGDLGIGITGSFAPNSNHVFGASSEDRRVWTAGFVLDRTLRGNSLWRLDYEASFDPFFQERDPTLTSTIAIVSGLTVVLPITPTRVVNKDHVIEGYLSTGGPEVPTYANTFGTEKTYGMSVSPIGARVSILNSKSLQPTFGAELGAVVSYRSLPIDDASNVNYLFSFGPGLEYFFDTQHSVRVEYVLRHYANLNLGASNPGVDAGVFRVTLSSRRKQKYLK
jgi:hypothetical protein